VPKDENDMLECACGSKTWYTRDEFSVTVTAARGAFSVTRSGGNHRPVPHMTEPVTRCTSCEQTMEDAVAQL
jgi:hypothetical protein